ncbi:Uncharacterised protein [uncultured archaeon]|nr:Uncharacterised protein [uncultured archaeon]
MFQKSKHWTLIAAEKFAGRKGSVKAIEQSNSVKTEAINPKYKGVNVNFEEWKDGERSAGIRFGDKIFYYVGNNGKVISESRLEINVSKFGPELKKHVQVIQRVHDILKKHAK